jgi:hypothetical protein
VRGLRDVPVGFSARDPEQHLGLALGQHELGSQRCLFIAPVGFYLPQQDFVGSDLSHVGEVELDESDSRLLRPAAIYLPCSGVLPLPPTALPASSRHACQRPGTEGNRAVVRVGRASLSPLRSVGAQSPSRAGARVHGRGKRIAQSSEWALSATKKKTLAMSNGGEGFLTP